MSCHKVYDDIVVLDDLSGATVVNPGSTNTLLALGGNSVLSIPANPNMDGRLFRLVIAGEAAWDGLSGTNFNGNLYFGNAISGPNELFAFANTSNVTNANFFYVVYGLWDSHSDGLSLGAGPFGGYKTNVGALSFSTVSSLSVQTDIQFVFSAQFNNTSNPNSCTLSQFSLQLV